MSFGAVETMRLPGKDGKLIHAAIQIGGASIMLVDESRDWGALSPKSLNGTPVTIHLYVDDVDAFVERAVKAGAVGVLVGVNLLGTGLALVALASTLNKPLERRA